MPRLATNFRLVAMATASRRDAAATQPARSQSANSPHNACIAKTKIHDIPCVALTVAQKQTCQFQPNNCRK